VPVIRSSPRSRACGSQEIMLVHQAAPPRGILVDRGEPARATLAACLHLQQEPVRPR
jgi:hypothetical protein